MFESYLKEIFETAKAGDAREESYYPALKADISENAWEELYSMISRPFPKLKTGKIAVKVINHYGDEVMKIIDVK